MRPSACLFAVAVAAALQPVIAEEPCDDTSPRLQLVRRGHPGMCVFREVTALRRQGRKAVRLQTLSPPNLTVAAACSSPRELGGGWGYIPLVLQSLSTTQGPPSPRFNFDG